MDGVVNLASTNTGGDGDITVTDGRLDLNSTVTTRQIVVNGTLGGSGTITTTNETGGGGITVGATGKLAPGQSIGTLTMALGTSNIYADCRQVGDDVLHVAAGMLKHRQPHSSVHARRTGARFS